MRNAESILEKHPDHPGKNLISMIAYHYRNSCNESFEYECNEKEN